MTLNTNTLRSLMGKQAIAVPEQIQPVSKIIEQATKEKEQDRIVALKQPAANADIMAMLHDKTIPLSERIRLRKELLNPTIDPKPALADNPVSTVELIDKSQFSLDITLNKKQLLAAEFASQGKSFVLTGKAGTGKTTAAREIAKALLRDGKLRDHYFGYYKRVAPSIAFAAYTNRATDNMRRALHKDPALEDALSVNVLTIHKLLEYTMEWITKEDGKVVPRFYPLRNASNKLDLTHLIIEEGSMVDLTLGKQLISALRPDCAIIVIGDINQLPPVFGASVLNYALIQLPVIELDEVYRQALDSPILRNALNVLDGLFPTEERPAFSLFQSKPGGTLVSEQKQAAALINTIKQWHKNGNYNPDTDIVLSPFNKDKFPCSTKKLNYHIAQYLGDLVNAKVHEVIAGRNVQYLAVGDRVMIEKEDGQITKIAHNGHYIGKQSQSILYDINRFGKPLTNQDQDEGVDEFKLDGYDDLNVDEIPENEKTVQASHIVDVLMDDGRTVTLESAGDFSDTKFSLGYCLSVHKAQGSEWRKVIFVIHRNFNVLLFRELIYTAMTRAREELVIVDMSNALKQGLSVQRIKGNSVKEKIEWFNSKIVMSEPFNILPEKELGE